MSNIPRMGRGLDALWNNNESNDKKNEATTLPISDLIPNPHQPRRKFNETALEELAASIKEQGIIQPILVRPKAQSKKFEIVAGERRYRAAQKAQLTEVPVFIKEMSDEEVMAAALIENIQREDLTPIEEALALQSLREECGITQDELAKRLGKSRSALANTLRLLQLNSAMQESLNKGELQAGHARTLLSLQGNEEAQTLLHEHILTHGLSVRDAEAAVAFFKEQECFPWEKTEEPSQEAPTGEVQDTTSFTEQDSKQQSKKSNRTKSSYMKSLQENLKTHLAIKASVSGNEERGRITLTYTNAEELMHLLLRMGIEQNASGTIDDGTFPVKQ